MRRTLELSGGWDDRSPACIPRKGGKRMSEKTVRLAAKLYEAREGVRLLLGDRFAEEMRKGGELLTALSASRGETVLQTAARLGQQYNDEDRPFASMVVVASAVELLEPSERAGK